MYTVNGAIHKGHMENAEKNEEIILKLHKQDFLYIGEINSEPVTI